MSLHTNPIVSALRRLGRAAGVNRLLGQLLRGYRYEDRFDQAVTAAIVPGDCVWDVGANVGHYTNRFADLVGEAGRVVAFEPSPLNAARLREACATRKNVDLRQLALRDREDRVPFVQGEDELGATSQLSSARAAPAEGQVLVEVTRGDDVARRGVASAPNVLKIDTEGYELEVLAGMGALLSERTLRAVCVEVHFALLERRGLRDAPARIVDMLERAGFSVRWPDASHLVAERAP